MNLFGRILSFLSAPPPPQTRERQPPTWEENRYGYLGAVGESQYQVALRRVARTGRVCWATLLPEPDNPFDLHAVAVQIGGGEEPTAVDIQRALPEPLQVPAKLIGGTWGKPSFGVLLDCRVVEHMPTPKPVRKKKVTVDPSDQPF